MRNSMFVMLPLESEVVRPARKVEGSSVKLEP
jgi:hypothetical protein